MPEEGVSHGVVAKRRVKRGVKARGAEYDHEYLGKVLSGFDVILERVISEQFGGNGTEDDDDKGLLMNNGASDVASATTKVEGEVTREGKEAEGSTRQTGKERRESEVGDADKMAGNRGNVSDDHHGTSSGGFGLDSERVVQSRKTQKAFSGGESTSKASGKSTMPTRTLSHSAQRVEAEGVVAEGMRSEASYAEKKVFEFANVFR